MEVKICAHPTCDNFIGKKSFKLGMHPHEFCSHECVNDAFDLKNAGKRWFKEPTKVQTNKALQTPPENSTMPQVAARDFGDSGVVRRFCDNSDCKNPNKNPVFEIDDQNMTMITMSWKGRHGEYCSNECLKTEKEKDMSDEESPVSAGTPASKKKGGKKAMKKVAAKATKKVAKATGKAAASGNGIARSQYANELVVTVKKTDHGLRGKRAEAVDLLLKNGQSLGKFREALQKKEAAGNERISTYAGFAIKTAVDQGLATLK